MEKRDEGYKLRKAQLSDMESVFLLSNEEYVRRHAIHREKIVWHKHVAWFKSMLESEEAVFYVVVDEEDNFLGQVRYALDGEEATVSISLSKSILGKGLSKSILRESMEMLAGERLEVDKIYAFVFNENIPSMKLFTGVGYHYVDEENKLSRFVYEVVR